MNCNGTLCVWHLYEVDFDYILIVSLCKGLNDKGLADLSCAIYEKGVTTIVIVKLLQSRCNLAFYHYFSVFGR